MNRQSNRDDVGEVWPLLCDESLCRLLLQWGGREHTYHLKGNIFLRSDRTLACVGTVVNRFYDLKCG